MPKLYESLPRWVVVITMLRRLTAVSLLARGGARIARPLPCAALPLRSLLSTGTGGSPPRKPPADGRMADFNEQDKAPALFDAIAAEMVERRADGRIADFKPQDLAKTAWEFAKKMHKAPAV